MPFLIFEFFYKTNRCFDKKKNKSYHKPVASKFKEIKARKQKRKMLPQAGSRQVQGTKSKGHRRPKRRTGQKSKTKLQIMENGVQARGKSSQNQQENHLKSQKRKPNIGRVMPLLTGSKVMSKVIKYRKKSQ